VGVNLLPCGAGPIGRTLFQSQNTLKTLKIIKKIGKFNYPMEIPHVYLLLQVNPEKTLIFSCFTLFLSPTPRMLDHLFFGHIVC
jgi:hypothetical protein